MLRDPNFIPLCCYTHTRGNPTILALHRRCFWWLPGLSSTAAGSPVLVAPPNYHGRNPSPTHTQSTCPDPVLPLFVAGLLSLSLVSGVAPPSTATGRVAWVSKPQPLDRAPSLNLGPSACSISPCDGRRKAGQRGTPDRPPVAGEPSLSLSSSLNLSLFLSLGVRRGGLKWGNPDRTPPFACPFSFFFPPFE